MLNNCMVHSTIYKKRHDAVVSRVKKAGGQTWELVKKNQVVGGANLRSIIVLKKRREVLIIDVAIRFKNSLESDSEEYRKGEKNTRTLLMI